jgi:hypothetical protein
VGGERTSDEDEATMTTTTLTKVGERGRTYVSEGELKPSATPAEASKTSIPPCPKNPLSSSFFAAVLAPSASSMSRVRR